jgi:hypothetical protein
MGDNNIIYSKLRILAHAIPYTGDWLTPYLLHQGNVVMLPPKQMIEITKDNYHEVVDKLADIQIGFADSRPDPLISLFAMAISPPYYIEFLNFIKDDITNKEISELMSWIWTHTEFPNTYDSRRLIRLFNRVIKEDMMTTEEIEKYRSLPDEVEVYRGLQSEKAKVKALSWTLSEEKARWFESRWKKHAGVYKAKISKHHIFAYFSGRSEEEIVLDPRKLKEVQHA